MHRAVGIPRLLDPVGFLAELDAVRGTPSKLPSKTFSANIDGVTHRDIR